jgi:hypothetical protein
MNEIDLKTKIEGLEKAIKEHKDFTGTYESQLKETQKQLEDYNKPELTPMMIDKVEKAIEKAVGRFDFTDTDNFEIDYSLDYDGRVQCESHEFNNSYNLVDEIVTEVCNLFKEVDSPTEEENARDDKEAEELADNS